MGKEFSLNLQLQTVWVTEPIGAFFRRVRPLPLSGIEVQIVQLVA
jgi:hypothetical protein